MTIYCDNDCMWLEPTLSTLGGVLLIHSFVEICRLEFPQKAPARFVEELRIVRLRITVTPEPAGTQVRVDGWLGSEGAAELVRVMNAAAAPVKLLVHDLRGADTAGLSALRRLADEGTPMEGLSTYLRLGIASPTPPKPEDSLSLTRPSTPAPQQGKNITEETE